uniref:BED-type domain-containing protein n=1 Tax=Pundamilia nyererei TaxID=303518 RepID=A0A3B4G6N1_9CICH
MEGERCSFFSWKYGHYFEFLSTKDFNIKVRCTLCVGEKVLSTFKNTTSNLKKHLHGTVKLTERVPPSGPKQRAVTSAGGPTPSNNKSWTLVQNQFLLLMPSCLTERLLLLTWRRSLKAALNEIDFVSTTADIWTANNRGYMGVTLHWISRTTLERYKVALACRNRKRLLNKVVATVTDNGSNFVKAFQIYHPVTESDDETEEEDDGQLSLPPHRRCALHTINIICTQRAGLCIGAAQQNAHKRRLLIPTSTRWNSFFDAVKRIADIPMGELNTLCTKLGLKCFKDQEYQVLHEYCMAMKPLTAALDILQGDCPYATLLPTLEVLMQKTQAVKDDLSRVTAIQTRFTGVLDDKDALLAAASCPKFKLRDTRRRERVQQLLTAECCTTAPLAKKPASVPSATTSSSQGEMAEPEEETYSAEKEVMDYLMSGYDLQILHTAPVERLFSLGGLVLTPKRNRLSDKGFEKLLLMRYNHWFTRSSLLFPP